MLYIPFLFQKLYNEIRAQKQKSLHNPQSGDYISAHHVIHKNITIITISCQTPKSLRVDTI